MKAVLRLILWVLVCSSAAWSTSHAQDKAKDESTETLSAVVRVKARILPNARSAESLGTMREGNGVLIRDNLVLTIGYLVIEAEGIEVISGDGRAVPATLAGYDHATGFGLLRLVAPIEGRPLPLGDSTELAERDPVMVATYGGREGVSLAYVVSRRPASAFAARFIGTPPMNVVSLPALTGEGLLLGVRPEHIRLDSKGTAAIVDTVEYLGADSIVTCRVGTELLTVRLPGQVELKRESEAGLAWDADAVHLFDAASGLRVERETRATALAN